jgi:DNA-directed RNA polymerase sigma subunit (sigma70/sigma32)
LGCEVLPSVGREGSACPDDQDGCGTVDDSRALEDYMSAVRDLPPLRREREVELLKAARAGDKSSRQLAIEGLVEMTALLAIRYAPEGMRLIDAIQEANVVLNRFVDDPDCADPGLNLASGITAHFEALARGERFWRR